MFNLLYDIHIPLCSEWGKQKFFLELLLLRTTNVKILMALSALESLSRKTTKHCFDTCWALWWNTFFIHFFFNLPTFHSVTCTESRAFSSYFVVYFILQLFNFILLTFGAAFLRAVRNFPSAQNQTHKREIFFCFIYKLQHSIV